MIRSLNSAVSGIDANQTMLDVIGNNIANSNTTGYKTDRTEFEDLLGQQLSSPTAPTASVRRCQPDGRRFRCARRVDRYVVRRGIP